MCLYSLYLLLKAEFILSRLLVNPFNLVTFGKLTSFLLQAKIILYLITDVKLININYLFEIDSICFNFKGSFNLQLLF